MTFGRSRMRSRARDGAPSTSAFIKQAQFYGATDAFDFASGFYMRNRLFVPYDDAGFTFARASTGSAETTAGTLVEFASGVPRITDRGLLIEGARTNNVLYSETLLIGWAIVGSGTIVNSDTFDFTNQFGAGVETQSAMITAAGTVVTGSAYLSGSGTIEIVVQDASGSFAGTAATVNLTTTPTRYTVTRTLVDANCVLRIRNTSGVAVPGVKIQRMQLEAGAFASSYIKTTGSAAARLADSAYVTPSGYTWPVSIYAEIAGAMDTLTFPRLVQWEPGTGTRIELVNADPTLSTNRTFLYSGLGGGANAAVVSGLSAGVKRAATKIESGAIRLSVNGGAVQNGTATGTTATGDFYFGNRPALDRPLFDYIRRVAIFPRALTNAELQAITT